MGITKAPFVNFYITEVSAFVKVFVWSVESYLS